MMIFSLVAMTGLEKCCITSAYLWQCHTGERPVARGPLVVFKMKNKTSFEIRAYIKGCVGLNVSVSQIYSDL